MRVRQIAWSLVGGVAVFAACAVQKADDSQRVAVEDSAVDAVIDAIREDLGIDVEPAKDAKAGPATAIPVKCAISSEAAGGSPSSPLFWSYASAIQPGRTKEELAQARVMSCTSGSEWCTAGAWSTFVLQVKDGEIRYRCGVVSTAAEAEKTTVTFFMP